MSVYFAQVGPHIKIGYSANPERRVRRLFASETRYGAPAGTPFDLASRRLLKTIDGDTQIEHAVHQALSDFAVGNEWFVDEPEVQAFIATVETATSYEPVKRPAGPIPPANETDGMTPEQVEQYLRLIGSLFANTT